MNTFVENSYYGNGFPDDPILKNNKMIVRTDVDNVRKVVAACLKPEVSPLIDSNLAKKMALIHFGLKMSVIVLVLEALKQLEPHM